jgi:hypothetical protein
MFWRAFQLIHRSLRLRGRDFRFPTEVILGLILGQSQTD